MNVSPEKRQIIEQSFETAKYIMLKSIDCIDDHFKQRGYAENHPVLLAAFMGAVIKDYEITVGKQDTGEEQKHNHPNTSFPPLTIVVEHK